MAEDVDPRVRDSRDHASRHRPRVHAQFGMHGRDDDVELAQQRVVLVEGAVFEDVDLDAGEERESVPRLGTHQRDLLAQPFG